MRKDRMIKALVLSMVLGSATLMGQAATTYSESYALPTMVVTANRMETELAKTGADVAVVTRQDIEEKHYSDLGALLKTVPGVVFNTYGGNGETYTSNALTINGSQNIVVLVDGMRVNTNGSVSSTFHPSEIADVNAIERVEVLRGAAATLYGSDAQSGVINIITRKAKGPKTTVGFTTGSFGKRQWNVSTSGSDKDMYWQVSAQKRKTDDFTDGIGRTVIDRTDSLSLQAKIGKYVNEDGKMEFTVSTYKSDYVRQNKPTDKTPVNGEKDNKRFAFSYQDTFDNGLESQFMAYYNKNDLDDNSLTADRWLMNLVTYGFSEQLTYRMNNSTLIAGMEYYKDRIDKYKDKYSTFAVMPSMSTTSLFVQDDIQLDDKLSAVLGLRYDRNSVYGGKTSPAITLQYEVDKDWQVYTSYKQYFVAPKLYHLYSQAYGNADLKPETGSQLEFGVKGRLDKQTTVTGSLWYRDSDNVIIWKKLKPNDPNDWSAKYQNVLKEKGRGANITLAHQFDNYWSATVGYSYTNIDARPGEAKNRNGSLPTSSWNVGINYDNDRLNVGVTGRGIVNRIGNPRNKMDDKLTGYWVWNVTANYMVNDEMKVFAGINNIFDKHYTEQTYDLDPKSWYSQPGRNFFAGLEYTF